MAVIDQEQLIGSMVPDVYIQKITLENSGHTPRRQDPHIQHSLENKSFYSNAKKDMKITLNLVLKDKFDNNYVDTWFSQQDYKKYLSITVVQSTSSLATRILSSSNNAIRLANINSLGDALALVGSIVDTIKDLPEYADLNLTVDDALEIYNEISENIETHHVSLLDITQEESLIKNSFFESVDAASGGLVYDIAYSKTYTLPTDKPTHLSYLAVTAIDVEALANDFGLYVDDLHLVDLMSGKATLDTVIENGSVESTSMVFLKPTGEVWTGPVFKEDKTVKAGTPANPGPMLTKKKVPNNKIQDFRIFDKLEKIHYNIATHIENELINNNKIRDFSISKTLPNSDSAFFTNIGLTLDSDNNSKMIFGFNYGEMLRTHTRFSSLYNKYNQEELTANTKIKSMKLLRRRVTRNHDGLNQLGSPTQMRDVFDEANTYPAILVKGFDSSTGFTTSTSTLASLEEVGLTNFTNLRHFMATDFTMSSVTDGYYQYGVEIEIEDRTHQIVEGYIQSLTLARAMFNSYHKEAIRPSGPLAPAAFNITSGKFTESFVNEMYTQYPTSAMQPWVKAVMTYLNISSIMVGAPIDTELGTGIIKMIQPVTGTPHGISSFLKIMNDLISRLHDLVGTRQSVKPSPTPFTSSALSPTKTPSRFIKIKHFFNDKSFDSNLPKNMGYDYLSNGPIKSSPKGGLLRLSQVEYIKRAQAETLKYFNSDKPDVAIIKDGVSYNPGDDFSLKELTYLTPSNVKLDKLGGTCLLDSPHNTEKNVEIQTMILKKNADKKSPFLPILLPNIGKGRKKNSSASSQFEIAKFNFTNIMSTINVIATKPVSSAKLFPLPLLDLSYDPYADASDMMGFEWDNIDSITERTEKKERKSHEDDDLVDPTALFSLITQPMVMFGANLNGMFDQQTKPYNGAEMQKMKKYYSFSFYDLKSNINAISKMSANTFDFSGIVDNSATVSSSNLSGMKQVSAALQGKIVNIPNQIKALFIAGLNPSIVKYSPNPESDMSEHPLGVATFALNFKMLRKVEALTGYKVDSKGQPLLKSPIWTEVDHSFLQSMSGQNLLCRMVKYENEEIGVREPVGLRMPVYDKYFIMTPKSSQVLLEVALPPTAKYNKKIKNKLAAAVTSIPTEYLSNGVVNSIKINPTESIKAKINKLK